MPRIARSIEDVMLGEGVHGTVEERYADLQAIASVIANRAAALGVSPKDVVSVKSEFNAYGKAMPAGVEAYRDLAQQAWQDVQTNGPVHNAMFYATPSAASRLPNGINFEAETKGHKFFSDPNFGPIRTAQGWRKPDPQKLATVDATAYAPTPAVNPATSAIEEVMGGLPPEDIPSVGVPAGTVNELGVAETDGYTSPFGAMGDRITSDYGSRDRPKTSLGLGSSFHRGVDMSLEPGASGYPAEAAAGGVVQDISYDPNGYGMTVSVQHPDGNVSSYSHLQEVAGNIGIGSEIARGTPVGLVGNSGNSQASHLHFGMTDPTGASIDPQGVVGLNNQPSVPTPQSSPVSAPVASLGAENFDGGRFSDAADVPQGLDSLRTGLATQQARLSPNIDTARMAPSDTAPADGMAELRTMLEGQNAAAQTTPDLSSPSFGLVSNANAADVPTGPSISDLAAQYGSYGAGKVSPEQNLADDVMAQRLSTKQDRLPALEPARVVETTPIATQPLTGAVEPSAFAAEREIDPVTTTPAAVSSPAKQSLMSKDPNFGMPTAGQRMKDSLFNSKTAGSLIGGALGNLIGGPIGAVALGKIGGKLADKHMGDKVKSETPLQALFNIMMGRNQNVFPNRPVAPEGGTGYSNISRDQLNDNGRDIYDRSGQFRDAVDDGDVGLY